MATGLPRIDDYRNTLSNPLLTHSFFGGGGSLWSGRNKMELGRLKSFLLDSNVAFGTE